MGLMQGRVAIRPVRVVYGILSIYHHPDTYRHDTGGRALPGNQKTDGDGRWYDSNRLPPTRPSPLMEYGFQPIHREASGGRAGGAGKGDGTAISRWMWSTYCPRFWSRRAGWPGHPDRGGVNVEDCGRSDRELDRLPKVRERGRTDQIYVTSRLNKCLRPPRTRPRSSRTSTSPWSTCCWPRWTSRISASRASG